MEPIEYYKEDEHIPLTREQVDAAVESTADAPDRYGTLAKYRNTPWQDDSVSADPSAVNPSPSQPSLENGDTVVQNGKGVTMYGSKARVVDQKTGAERWYDIDANGGVTERKEAPVSMQIAANGGIAPDDTMRKFEKYNRMKSEEKAKARAGYNKVIADTLGGALDQVYRNETIREHNGQKYRVGIVDADALAGANTQLGKLGKNTVKKIFAMQQVAQTDSNQMLGEPQFVVEFNEDGVTKSDGKRIARMFTRSQIENIIRKSYEATGEASRGEDVIKALFRDRVGEIKAERETAAKKAAEAAKLAEDRRRWDAERRTKDLEARTKLVDVMLKNGDRPNDPQKLFNTIASNKEALEYFTNRPVLDDEGNPVPEVDEEGNPRTTMDANGNEVPVYKTKSVSPQELWDEVRKMAGDMPAPSVYSQQDYINFAMGGNGAQVQAPKAGVVQNPQAGGAEQKTALTNQQRLIAERERRAAARAAQAGQQQVQSVSTQEQPVASVSEQPVAAPQQVETSQQPSPSPAATPSETPDYRASLYGKDILEAIRTGARNVLAESPAATPSENVEQPAPSAETKRTEYTPAPNPRAKASRNIVVNDRKRQRGLDMSGTGYADKVAAIIDSEEQKADRRESRIATLMADAQKEYRDWQSGGRNGDFKFSNEDELNTLIRARLGNKDYDADIAKIVRNRLADRMLDEARSTDFYEGVRRGEGEMPRTLADIQRDIDREEAIRQGRRDVIANPALDESSERIDGLYERMKKQREEDEAKRREQRKRTDRILGIKRK